MGLIQYIIYIYLRLKLWLRKAKKNRFDVYTYSTKITDPRINNMMVSTSDWELATPNLKRDENILLTGTNTWGCALRLNMRWRPNENMKIATLVSRFSLECGPNKPIYDYEEVTTQSHNLKELDYIRKYQGKNIRLEVLSPYRRYRLFFSGYMRNRETKQLSYVRFRSIISNAGKIFDFKEQYDIDFMAKQLSEKPPNGGVNTALKELILQDRHEHTCQFRCTYNVSHDSTSEQSSSHQQEKLFCWGFHSRHFMRGESDERIRCKRILAYFSTGKYFHVGAIESIDNKFDPKQRMKFGYACPKFQLSCPIQELGFIDWDQITSDTRKLKFQLKAQGMTMDIESADGTSNEMVRASNFIDLVADGKKGRGIILINDSMVGKDDQLIVDRSVHEFIQQVCQSQTLIDLNYLELESQMNKFDTKRPMVVSLDQKECQYSSLCGAKAASLAQLLNYQSKIDPTDKSKVAFKVPNGVVLTRYAYDSILESNPDLRKEERRLASVVCRGKQDEIKVESERFQRIFSPSNSKESNGASTHLNIPQRLLNELEKMMLVTFNMNTINDMDKSYAVRSSSWGEDEDNMSAAGQLTTLLSVQGFNQLRDAIMICFGSKYSLTNLEYKRQHGLPIDMPMAIVIQEMVECDKAGVMFTCNPTDGDERQMVITANYGLGESVVSAAADPDSIMVGIEIDEMDPNDVSKRRASHIQSMTIGKKKVILDSDKMKSKQLEEYGLVSNQNDSKNEDKVNLDLSKCCLEEAEIFRLARCGLSLTHYFRCPRDIEWGIKQGQLFLFQSRPITGLDTMCDFELLHEFSSGLSAEKEWVSRANVGEVTPFALRPLTLTYIINSWILYMADQFIKLGFIDREAHYPQVTCEFTTISYFYFVLLRPSSTMGFGMGKDRPMAARALVISYFGHDVDEPELAAAASEIVRPLPLWSIVSMLIHGIPYRYFPSYMHRRAKATVATLRRDVLKHKFVRGSSAEDLLRQMHIAVCQGFNGWVTHIMLIFISPEYNHWLTSILAKYIDDPNRLFSCFSKLLSSSLDVVSAGVPRQIGKMAKVIGQNEGELERFLAMDDREALKYITSDPSSELTKLFNKFMETYGHRSYNEFELLSKPWREDPHFVVEMVKKSCKDQLAKQEANSTHCDNEDNKPLKGSALLSEMGIQLSLKDRLLVDNYVLPKCHQFVRIREDTKDLLIYITDCLRDAVIMLARQLRQEGRIPDEDLLCYMSLEELESVTKGHEPSIVDQAQRRRRFFKQLSNWKFDEIVSGCDFLPRHLQVDSEEVKAEKERMRMMPKISGTPASSGRVRGPVCIINHYDELEKVKPGDILVTYSTDIAFSPVFPVISGIVTEIGGMISHGAVIAREYGIPSLIGVGNATSILKDGELIELDATCGYIIRLELNP